MSYSVIVFDTAPTGHTLRLLSFPSVLERAFEKFNAVKEKFGGLLAQVSGMVQPATEQKLMGKLEQAKATIELINAQFKDPEQTTFVCVCIPEFLSLFETERLVQEVGWGAGAASRGGPQRSRGAVDSAGKVSHIKPLCIFLVLSPIISSPNTKSTRTTSS